MPAIPLAALIPALIGVATAGTETGLQLSGALSPGQPKTPTTQPVTPASQSQDKAALGSQLPNEQERFGGASLSPQSYLQYALGNTGLGNTPGAAASGQSAIDQFFGNIGGPSAGLTQSTGTQSGGLALGSPNPGGGSQSLVAQGINDLFKQFNLGGS
jgi:hypothetical protein